MDQSSVATAAGSGLVREIKEWQSVMDYLRALPVMNGNELPTIPVDERANEVRAIKVG
jgi:5'-nucleotidase/UDP-sugar diphosphatase